MFMDVFKDSVMQTLNRYYAYLRFTTFESRNRFFVIPNDSLTAMNHHKYLFDI